MNGTATTCSSVTATKCTAPIASTIAATRRWERYGATSISHRSAARRLGKIRQRVIRRPHLTNGGTGTIITKPRRHRTRSGSISSPTLRQRLEDARQRRKRAKERKPLRRLRRADLNTNDPWLYGAFCFYHGVA